MLFLLAASFLFHLGSCKKAAAVHKLSGSYVITTDNAISLILSTSYNYQNHFGLNDTITFHDNRLLIINSPMGSRSETTWDIQTGYAANAAPLIPGNPEAIGLRLGDSYDYLDFAVFDKNQVVLEYEGDVIYEFSPVD